MRRPNVLLVYPDQLRYDCLSFTGNPTVRTPAIDALAAGGVSFSAAYCSFPLCCPFRASLMTGLYAHEHGMATNHYPVRLGQTFLPELMGQAGYRTGWFGKWHLNGGDKFDFVPPEYRLGFETFVGYSRGHDYLHGIYYRDDDRQPYKSDTYEPEYQSDHVIEFMADSVAKKQPFMAMICYGLPHSPVESAPDRYKNMYKPSEVTLPDTVPPALVEQEKAYRAMYYGLVTCVDDQIARLTRWLLDSGLEEDTLVIFVSDHGDMNGEYGLHYKSSYYEASMHVPCIMRYPATIKAGTTVDQLIDPSIDLMPTILDVCSVAVPAHVRGRSLKQAMTAGHDASLPAHVLYQLPRVSEQACAVLDVQECKRYAERGLRTKQYLYVEKCKVPFALFDLKADPHEKYNCVNNVDYVDVVESLRCRLHEVMEAVGDDWSAEASEPPPGYHTHEEGKAITKAIRQRAVYEQ